MTGSEHYREAERLLSEAGGGREPEAPSTYLAAAQVHATLALAAAVVAGVSMTYEERDQWQAVVAGDAP